MVVGMNSILRELEQVQDQLSALTPNDGPEHYQLMTRLEELRTRAARLAENVDAEYSTQELLIRLASLQRRRALLDRQHGSASRGLHRPRHGSRGASQVDAHIDEICSLLADRGIRVH